MSNTILHTLNDREKTNFISDLKEFYIPYRQSLELPEFVTFGGEIEFKIPGFDSEYLSSSRYDNDDTVEHLLSNLGYSGIWKSVYEVAHHMEIISDVLTDTNNTWCTLESILSFLLENEAYYSGRCSSHVHVGKQVMGGNANSWIRFLKLWSVFENAIIKFTNGEHHFERLNFKKYSGLCHEKLMQILKSIDQGNYHDADLHYEPKKFILEFNSLYFSDLLSPVDDFNEYNVDNTIEFRSPNGTLNKVIWQNNINFFCKLLLSCNGDFDDELLEYLYKKTSILNNEEYNLSVLRDDLSLILADFVFNNDFDKQCFLRQYYKDSSEITTYDPLALSNKFWK